MPRFQHFEINMRNEPWPLAKAITFRPLRALQKQRFVLRVNAAPPAVVFIMKARTTLVRDWSSTQKDPTKVGALTLLKLDTYARRKQDQRVVQTKKFLHAFFRSFKK